MPDTPEHLSKMPTAPFDKLVGLEYTSLTPEGVSATLTVTENLLQPNGIVHGGVYCSVVESVASVSAYIWRANVLGEESAVVGVNNNTDFLRAISSGTLTATSTPIHRGRRQQLWLVTITDDENRTIARGQVRLQNL
ncbi:putative esterase [Mycobacteroides salmoniphilum]|uniref:Esterase n=1 Tax=Mycobacteroides salmoniphilum TaxID=404941 RepID=A0A4R8S3D7_9MYCO|nr:PaaI family thioesterase [Mycobacteroides salmoniphilum]TDZ77689.1 putative esterase [Mycobacteroides salmoniphilum]TDZ82320.1 putative esterase [Mycobacteroides salmoniphilum]TDZ85335.1 putative esterase [Mycobacteroides salmoniphilum]TDZ92944.1 putative esterase [Mycobacteroides salmoniphilum]TEA07535.1 putative esterase [Mycobacteroides salmoniphilum]